MKVTAVYTVWIPVEIPDNIKIPDSHALKAGDAWNDIISSYSSEWQNLPKDCELYCVYDTQTEKTLWE